MGVMGVNECLQRHAHVLGKLLSSGVILHHTTTCVMLAMPNNFIRGFLVEAQTEWWLVLPHLTCHIITAAKLVGEAFAIGIQDKATHSTERLSCQKLDLGIRVIWLH